MWGQMPFRRTSIFVSSVLASSVFVLASIAAGCGSPAVESVFDPDGGEWGERDGDGSVIVRDRDASRLIATGAGEATPQNQIAMRAHRPRRFKRARRPQQGPLQSPS